MLINRVGIDETDVVVDLDSRRLPVITNPKSRITMAMVLHSVLTSFQTSDPLGTPTRRVVPVSYLNSRAQAPIRSVSSRSSAA